MLDHLHRQGRTAVTVDQAVVVVLQADIEVVGIHQDHQADQNIWAVDADNFKRTFLIKQWLLKNKFGNH